MPASTVQRIFLSGHFLSPECPLRNSSAASLFATLQIVCRKLRIQCGPPLQHRLMDCIAVVVVPHRHTEFLISRSKKTEHRWNLIGKESKILTAHHLGKFFQTRFPIEFHSCVMGDFIQFFIIVIKRVCIVIIFNRGSRAKSLGCVFSNPPQPRFNLHTEFCVISPGGSKQFRMVCNNIIPLSGVHLSDIYYQRV